MNLRDAIDELDALVVELSRVRDELDEAGVDDASALWIAESELRRAARRAEHRADLLRRTIELQVRETGRAHRPAAPRTDRPGAA